jgi:hypothetical protein
MHADRTKLAASLWTRSLGTDPARKEKKRETERETERAVGRLGVGEKVRM